jgi:hypothetical protein
MSGEQHGAMHNMLKCKICLSAKYATTVLARYYYAKELFLPITYRLFHLPTN